MVKNKRISHAQLLLGPSGNGGIALAIAYAQYICCLDRGEDDSCGTCSSCRKYQKLIHPDLHFSFPFFPTKEKEISEAFLVEWREALFANPFLDFNYWRKQCEEDKKQANINIAEVHQIIKKIALKPFESEFKVLIMWLPEYLDKQGNALLKLIEEPPPNTLFIFVAENRDRLLPTLLSRMQLIPVPRLNAHEIAAYLQEEFTLSPDRAQEVALMCEGDLASGISLAQEASDDQFDLFVQWLRYCATDSGKSLINLCENDLAPLGRENQKSLVQYALSMMRQVILHKEGLGQLSTLPQTAREFVEKFSSLYSIEQLDASIELLENCYYRIERNANAKLLFLDLSLQLVLILKYQTIRAMADTII